MTKIKNTNEYPIKKYPVVTDFFIGSDSQDNGTTVNFGIQTIVNMVSGLMDYTYSTSSLPITSPNGDGFFQTNGVTDFSLITHIYVSKKTLAGQDLTPFMNFMKLNINEFTLYIVSKTTQNIFADFAITNVVEHTDYFDYTVMLAPGDNYLGQLANKDIYTFRYEKKASGSILDILSQTIDDGDTTHAPSGNAVFDALALKANDANVIHTTGNEIKTGSLTVNSIIRAGGTSAQYLMADGSISTISNIASSIIAPTIVDGDTTHAPSGDAVFDALALKLPLTGGTMTGEIVFQDNSEGITFFNGGRIYHKAGDGLFIKLAGGNIRLGAEDNNNNFLGLYAYTSEAIQWSGTATGLNPSLGRTSLGGTTIGQNVFTSINPSAITFLRANADNSVSWLDASSFRTAIGTATGTVNRLAKFTSPNVLGDSNISDSGILVSISTGISVNGTIVKVGGLSTQYLKADGSVSTDANIVMPASQVAAVSHVDYLTGANVQLQLDQTETNIVGIVKTDKTNYKDIYQTGRVRIDTDASVVTISPANTLNITLVDDILFVNEIVPNTNANKLADFLLSFGTRVFVASGANTPLAANTRGVFYLGINKLGTPVYQVAKVYDQDICYLARVIIENLAGVYTIISFKYFPDLANNRVNNRDRTVLSSGYIVPSGAASISFGNRGVTFGKNSINYSNNKFDPNFLSVVDSVNPAPMQFLFALPNLTSLATSIALSTVINPTQWYLASGAVGGGAVGGANYQVYRLMVTVTGTIVIQTKASTSNAPTPGVNAIFANRDDALAGLTSTVFPDILPIGDSIPLGTFYLRAGTAANGSQLNDPNDFYFRPFVATSSSSTVGVTDHDLLSNKNVNPAFQHVTTGDIANWNVAYNNRITALTTTGSSGASTLIANTLNIPNYTLAGLGGQPQLNGVGFVKANGTVISYDNTSYQPLLANPITGTGAAGQVSFWNGTNSQSGDNNLFWDNTNKRLGIGTSGPAARFDVVTAVNTDAIAIAGWSVMRYSTGDTIDIGSPNSGQWTAVRFMSNGSEAMRLTSSGNVGIGTTAPNAKATFRVATSTGSGSGDGITINDVDTNPMGLHLGINSASSYSWIQSLHQGFGYEKLILNPNGGNVGIGTTNPLAKLSIVPTVNHVVGGQPTLRICEATGNETYGLGISYYAPPSQNYVGKIQGFRAGTTPTDLLLNPEGGNVGIGTTSPDSNLHVLGLNSLVASARYLKTHIGGASGWGVGAFEELGIGYSGIRSIFNGGDNWDLGFSVGTSAQFAGGTQPNAILIKSNGNVGIGTTSPNAKIHSRATSTYNSETTGSLALQGGTSTKYLYAGFDESIDAAFFQTVQPGVGYKSLLLNAVGGNVGIGTTSPTEKLHVVGNGLFTGTVTASGGFFNSDLRLKDIIKRDGDVAYFKWKDGRDDKEHVGVIAQELQKTNPDMVQEGADGILSVNYIELLLEKIRGLEKRIDELENR
jgi:hypothetical protein